jgi:hypothetical protein
MSVIEIASYLVGKPASERLMENVQQMGVFRQPLNYDPFPASSL